MSPFQILSLAIAVGGVIVQTLDSDEE